MNKYLVITGFVIYRYTSLKLVDNLKNNFYYPPKKTFFWKINEYEYNIIIKILNEKYGYYDKDLKSIAINIDNLKIIINNIIRQIKINNIKNNVKNIKNNY